MIHSRTYGTGSRPALALHCSLGSGSSWASVAQQIGDISTLTAIDLPGHGRSADWDGVGDYQAACLKAALEFAPEPVDVLGHSFGATVALRMAAQHPERIRSLVLFEPVFFAVANMDDPDGFSAHLTEMAEFDAAMAVGDQPTATRAFLRVWGDGTPWDMLPRTVKDQLIKRIPLVGAGAASIFDDSAGLLGKGVLQGITAPTLLMQGGLSPAVISQINAGLVRRLPNVQDRCFSDTGHMGPITHADQVGRAIRDFLKT